MEKYIFISKSQKSWEKLNIKALWQYRGLIYTFAKRDIRVHYSQTKLGIVWSFIQALTAALIINLFFGVVVGLKVENVPYLVFAYPGLMGWYYFSYIVNNSGTALVQSQHLIKKIYFPKLILPVYKTLVGLVELLIWFLLYIMILIFYGQSVPLSVVFLPIAILLNIITGLSIAIWLSALTIKYRDAFHIIPYLIGFGVFVTPVFYQTSMIPEKYHFLIYFNPMAGVITFYRWCFFDIDFSYHYLAGFIPVVIVLITGMLYFRKVEGTVADLI